MFLRMKTFLIVISVYSALLGCGDFKKNKSSKEQNSSEEQKTESVETLSKQRLEYQATEDEIEVYSFVERELAALESTGQVYLRECHCHSNFIRDFRKIDLSSRYQFDRHVSNYMTKEHKSGKTLNLVFFGSGTLLNELTILTKLSQAGFNLNVYLLDTFYFLHDQEDADEQLKYYRNHLDEVPKDQPIWDYEWKTLNVQEMVEVYLENHRALTQFYQIAESVSEKFLNSITINVSENSPQLRKKLEGVTVDGVFAIDAFQNTPNIIWNLKYRPFVEVEGEAPFQSVFFTLNKEKDNGNFAEYEDDSFGVNIEINQISFKQNSDFSVRLLHKEYLTDKKIVLIKQLYNPE